jgi:cytochrome P450
MPSATRPTTGDMESGRSGIPAAKRRGPRAPELLADEALDHLASEAARAGGTVDLLAHFARPFPLAVICEMLGLPPEDRPNFTRWASRFSTSSSFVGILWGLFTGVRQLLQYTRSEFRRQLEPRPASSPP